METQCKSLFIWFFLCYSGWLVFSVHRNGCRRISIITYSLLAVVLLAFYLVYRPIASLIRIIRLWYIMVHSNFLLMRL